MTTEASAPSRVRAQLPLEVQVRVLFRDGWLCRWCCRPTVFSPTLRLLQRFVETFGYEAPLAYFHPDWRRDAAPLLDHMGAVIDHVEAVAPGGEHSEANFVTACNTCTAKKSNHAASAFEHERPGTPVKGRFGEPEHWDGLISLFLVLARSDFQLTSGEKAWQQALEAHVRPRKSSNTPRRMVPCER